MLKGARLPDEPFFCFIEPADPGPAVSRKFEKKFSLVAVVGVVSCVSGQKAAFGSGHGQCISACAFTIILDIKPHFKSKKWPIMATLSLSSNDLARSDP